MTVTKLRLSSCPIRLRAITSVLYALLAESDILYESIGGARPKEMEVAVEPKSEFLMGSSVGLNPRFLAPRRLTGVKGSHSLHVCLADPFAFQRLIGAGNRHSKDDRSGWTMEETRQSKLAWQNQRRYDAPYHSSIEVNRVPNYHTTIQRDCNLSYTCTS